MHPDQSHHHERQEHDVPHEHLTKVGDVEDGPGPRGIDAVLRLGADPLRIKVLLGEVAGEGCPDRHHE